MTLDEVIEELKKIFPNSTVSASEDKFYHYNGKNSSSSGSCSVFYNFGALRCSRKEGSSFEECLKLIEDETNAINEEISKYSILFRQF